MRAELNKVRVWRASRANIIELGTVLSPSARLNVLRLNCELSLIGHRSSELPDPLSSGLVVLSPIGHESNNLSDPLNQGLTTCQAQLEMRLVCYHTLRLWARLHTKPK